MTFSREEILGGEGLRTGEYIVTVTHEDGIEQKYRGQGTVWFTYPDAIHNTHIDTFMVRLMKLMDWGIFEDD